MHAYTRAQTHSFKHIRLGQKERQKIKQSLQSYLCGKQLSLLFYACLHA